MSIVSFSHIVKFFTGDHMPSAEESQKLFEEALLLTLSRATSADSNINPVEVETVQSIFAEYAGHDVEEKDVRIAAISDLYDEATLEGYISNVSYKIRPGQRLIIAQSLAKLIKADDNVSPFEVAFYNGVVNALRVTPAELMGLQEDPIKV